MSKTKTSTWPHPKDTTYVHELSGGDRSYRVKKSSLKKVLEDTNTSQFEKHLIQEGLKQVIFAQGSEECITYVFRETNQFMDVVKRTVPKEMIQFLLDYDVIEKHEF